MLDLWSNLWLTRVNDDQIMVCCCWWPLPLWTISPDGSRTRSLWTDPSIGVTMGVSHRDKPRCGRCVNLAASTLCVTACEASSWRVWSAYAHFMRKWCDSWFLQVECCDFFFIFQEEHVVSIDFNWFHDLFKSFFSIFPGGWSHRNLLTWRSWPVLSRSWASGNPLATNHWFHGDILDIYIYTYIYMIIYTSKYWLCSNLI